MKDFTLCRQPPCSSLMFVIVIILHRKYGSSFENLDSVYMDSRPLMYIFYCMGLYGLSQMHLKQGQDFWDTPLMNTLYIRVIHT